MELNKLLLRQLNKYLPDWKQDDSTKVEKLIQAINESYNSFQRDKELSNHAFAISEKEYHEINRKLKFEISSKKISIEKLKEVINQLDESSKIADNEDELISVIEYVRHLITKQKDIEAELVKSINRVSTLIGNLHTGVLVENENREIVFTNDAFCKIFSIPLKPKDLVGLDCSKSAEETKFMFKNSDKFLERINQLLKQKVQVIGDVLEMEDGRILERDFIPIYVDNDYRGHLWNYYDITERKKITDAVANSEAKYKLIMNSALDAILIADDNGKITFWNPKSEEIFGWKQEEVIGKKLEEVLIPEQFRSAHINGFNRFLKTREERVLRRMLELTAINKNGEQFPIELSVTPIYFEDTISFCGFIRDISIRKKVENALQASEEKYRSIIANMNLGLLEVDLEDKIQYCNQSFTKLSGYELNEIEGKLGGDLFSSSKYNKSLINEKNKLRQKGVSDSYELEVFNKDGETRWWLVSGAPNINDKGECIGSIGIHLDITQQKVLEKELEKALKNAQEASRAKEAFLANMSHEIRTPLNAIIGMIRELGKEDLTPKQNSYLNHSETASKHLLSIVNNILDISKIEAGELELENKDFSPVSVINMVQSILHIRTKEKGLQFIINISKDIRPALLGDGGRIRQILINIVGNAIKFTESGSVTMQVEVLETKEDFQNLYFLIEDTGIGMSDEFLSAVYDKFSQEEVISTKKYEGTGLGMAITKELINLMGGKMNITSEKNRGTKVEIFLKLKIGQESKIIQKNELLIDKSLTGLRCLLVEDNDMNRLIASKSLDYFGCVVTEAVDGLKAIEKLKNNSFDFILMDIQMPHMDGVETTRYIRNEMNNKIPIIALTANAFKSDIDLYLSIGMNDYVTKPFEEHILFSTIANTLNVKTFQDNMFDLSQITSESDNLYNLSKLYEIGRGDVSFVNKMIQIFVDYTPTTLNEISTALQNNDFIQISRLAHRMKPSIDNLGIVSLLNTVKDLELETKKEDVNKPLIEELVNYLQVILTKVIQKLKEK